jgi:GTPase SAR1 family protein
MSDVIDYIVNILLVGDTAVGKSNIVTRFIRDEFYEYQMPTIGVDFQ